MRQHCHVSRRAMLAGSAAALALTLPKGALAQARQPFPAMVKVAWGENESDPRLRSRLIAAVAQAMAESGSDIRATWVLAGA
jgi:ABC-type sugar transport system substrate-binding protein